MDDVLEFAVDMAVAIVMTTISLVIAMAIYGRIAAAGGVKALFKNSTSKVGSTLRRAGERGQQKARKSLDNLKARRKGEGDAEAV